jgi:hypothetical protein
MLILYLTYSIISIILNVFYYHPSQPITLVNFPWRN